MNTRHLMLGVLAGGLALGLIACGDDDWGDDDDSGATNSQRLGDAASAQSGGVSAPDTGEASSDDAYGLNTGGQSLAQLDRKIIFTANMTLSADDVSASFNQASILARSNGGYIESSNFSGGADPERRSATLTVRVPVENYEGFLASVRGMSGLTVESEGSNSSEVTEQYTDLSSRLRNLERTEQQYLDLLAQATTINDILTVQDRLTSVREQIEQIQGRLNVLDNMTDFATVSMTFVPVLAVVETPKESGAPSLASVWQTSWERSLEAAQWVAAAGVVIVVATAWLIVPVALVALAARRFRRPTPPVTSSEVTATQ